MGLLRGIGFFVIGTIFMLLVTYGLVSIYAFATWDWDLVTNLHVWLHPATNLWVRVGALVGAAMSFFGGILSTQFY